MNNKMRQLIAIQIEKRKEEKKIEEKEPEEEESST